MGSEWPDAEPGTVTPKTGAGSQRLGEMPLAKVPGWCPQLVPVPGGRGSGTPHPPARPALGPVLLAVPRTGKGRPPAQGDPSAAVHTPGQAPGPSSLTPWSLGSPSAPPASPPSPGPMGWCVPPPGAKLATTVCTLLCASKAEMRTPGGARTERPPRDTRGPEDLPSEPQLSCRGPTPGTRPCLLMPQHPPKWQGTWAGPHAGHMGVVLARAHQGRPLPLILGERGDPAWTPGGPQGPTPPAPAHPTRPRTPLSRHTHSHGVLLYCL